MFTAALTNLENCYSELFNYHDFENKQFWHRYYGVVNLSDYDLTKNQLKVLGRGLKFCPTPGRFDHGRLKEDIDRFFRSVSLHIFFNSNTAEEIPDNNDPTKPFSHKELKLPSKFNPPMPSNLEIVYNMVMEEILKYNPNMDRTRNLQNSEFKALEELRNLEDRIIIRKADKGSNIVIMNRKDYIMEGKRQLNDTKFYKKIKTDLSAKHKQEIDKLVTDMFGASQISENTLRYLITGGERTSIFYLLPKIHKRLKDPPGRPIVSSVDCPTERISHLLDLVLQPLIIDSPSFILDTPDFIRKITKIIDLNENDWLFSLDVVGLYTNIPLAEGLESTRQILKKRPQHAKPNADWIIKLLEAVLTKNNFRFNDEHFLQMSGTAMGTRVAPTYSNIFMIYFENQYVYTYKNPPKYWFRFIDDIFGIFRGSEKELFEFYEYLNNIHETIKFTLSHSKKLITFLDVNVHNTANRLTTSLYSKPTDSHSYLDFGSCHPQNTKKSIPYSQFLRIRRNCTSWIDFVKSALQMYHHFTVRGYPIDLLKESLLKVSTESQYDLINTNQNTFTEKQFYCITEFNPSNPEISLIIRKAWAFLDRSSSTRFLVDIPLIFGNRKPKNISDLIIRSDIKTMERIKRFPPKCRNPAKCRHCPKINRTGFIKSSSTSREYKIPRRVTCNSKNLIYCIECKLCRAQYVGQTKNKFLIRINQHLSDIRIQKDTPISRHFNRKCKLASSGYILHVLQLIDSDNSDKRDKFENQWIARLCTLTPHGLNILD